MNEIHIKSIYILSRNIRWVSFKDCLLILGLKYGWYLKADASAALYSGSVTTLSSSVISSSGPHCTLEFWYYMNGNHVGTLSVLTNDIALNVLWSRTGNQGTQWIKGIVAIGSRRNFQVNVHFSIKYSLVRMLSLLI